MTRAMRRVVRSLARGEQPYGYVHTLMSGRGEGAVRALVSAGLVIDDPPRRLRGRHAGLTVSGSYRLPARPRDMAQFHECFKSWLAATVLRSAKATEKGQ